MTESHWDDPQITAFVLNELPEDARAEFEQRMADDPSLAAAVEQAREVTGQLATLFQTESTPALDPSRRAAIIEKTVIIRPHDEQLGKKWLFAAIGLAASILVVIGLMQQWASSTLQLSQRSDSAETESSAGHGRIAFERNVGGEAEEADFDGALEAGALEAMVESIATSDHELTELALKPTAPAEPQRASRRTAGRSIPQPEPMGMGGGMGTGADFALGDRELPASGPSNSRNLSSSNSPVRPMLSKAVSPMPSQSVEVANRFGAPGAISSKGAISPKGKEMYYQPTPTADDGVSLGLRAPSLGGANPEGQGPQLHGDRFDLIKDNAFRRVSDHPLSTFSVDVDTASYSKVRDFLMRANQLPRPDAVRIEELINYFDYADQPPADDAEHPFAARVNVTTCPWNPQHRLARIAIKGKTMQPEQRPACNLVFLIDTSGSMNAANKLPLVIQGMTMLTKQLEKKDRVSIVVYAGSAGLVLDSTSAKKRKKIEKALEQLSSSGSTNGGQGIALAYQTARENFIEDGVNRVILCTDGDFNVGTTGTDALVRMVEKESKDNIFLSVLGFGMGNHNDSMLEQISGRGNGNYAFIDTPREAHKVLVEQAAGTLVTIAKDVKLQIEFNPAKVSAYRLIGYENRILAKEDFNDDKKDAGEIGAGHSVTALYELVPPDADKEIQLPEVDDLKYQTEARNPIEEASNETMTVKLRYKQPDGDTSTKVEYPVVDEGTDFAETSIDTRFTAAVAGFGMQLRRSEHAGDWTIKDVLEVAKSAKGDDENGLRAEFVTLVERAAKLMGQ